MSRNPMKGRWPKQDNDDFDNLVIALDNARDALPEWSFGKLIQAATIIQAGYWPGTLKHVTNAELMKGLKALIPDPDEADWVIPEDEVESTYV